MTKNRKSLIRFAGVMAVVLLGVYYYGQSFRKEHFLTSGVITRCDGGGKGNWGPGIYYSYYANGTLVNGSRRHSYLVYSIHNLKGHSFPVVYNKTWLGYNDVVLVTPADFSYYGYDFPDSLKWVLQYVKK